MNNGFQNIVDAPLHMAVDVIVAGGGPAGVAAAETAARRGLSVLLVEKEGFLGGQAVGGLSATICGMYLTNEEWTRKNGPEQLVFGFAGRFREKMKEQGGLTEPQLYGNTYVDAHEPFVWKCVAEEMLQDAGVSILYHATICQARTENQKISEIFALTPNGFICLKAKWYVDATGDAALATAAGGQYRFGLNGVVQNPSLIFKLSNIDDKIFWDYYGENTICHDAFSDQIRQAEEQLGQEMPRKKIWVFRCVNQGEIYVNATSVSKPDGTCLNCIYPSEISYAETVGRKQAKTYAKFLKTYIPGCEQAHIGEHASQIGVRQTRSVNCRKRLKNLDVENCVKTENGVAKSSWPIEVHAGEAPTLLWLHNDYYEIPFGSMIPKGFQNLIVSGRCIDAEHQALASSRVTAQCFSLGHAAGIAVDIARKKNISFDVMDGSKVRQALNLDGAKLD